MDWLQLILSNLVSLLVGLGGSILYFRPKLKEARAAANMKETEAQNFIYESLIGRINEMEKSNNEQYAAYSKTVGELRAEVLKLTAEKFDTEKRMRQVEAENSSLRERVDQLEKEVQAYKIIAGK